MQGNLIIVRGLPGSGKSTIAEFIDRGAPRTRSGTIIAADDYPGLYTRNESGNLVFHGGEKDENGVMMISKAHEWCQGKTRAGVSEGGTVVVHNTFVERWEIEPYRKIADECGARFTILSVFNDFVSDDELASRNSHGVPKPTITRMRGNWEPESLLHKADSRPPWERPEGESWGPVMRRYSDALQILRNLMEAIPGGEGYAEYRRQAEEHFEALGRPLCPDVEYRPVVMEDGDCHAE